MFKHCSCLFVLLMFAAPGSAMGQADDEEPIDLELHDSSPAPVKKAPAEPARAPAHEAEEAGEDDDLDLGEDQAGGGLATFDAKLQLDEPGVLPSPGMVPARAGLSLTQGRGARGRAWPLWPALVAGGVAVVTLAVGAYLVSIDETGAECTGEPRPDLRNCIEVYNTGDAGYAITAVGIASLATAGLFTYLFLRGHLSQPEEEGIAGVSVAPDGRGGVVFGASGRF
jgi:hypothetical protein